MAAGFQALGISTVPPCPYASRALHLNGFHKAAGTGRLEQSKSSASFTSYSALELMKVPLLLRQQGGETSLQGDLKLLLLLKVKTVMRSREGVFSLRLLCSSRRKLHFLVLASAMRRQKEAHAHSFTFQLRELPASSHDGRGGPEVGTTSTPSP